MKIAHLVSTFPPYHGGMGNVCFVQAEELAKLGHQVIVFVPGNPQNNRKEKGFEIRYLKPLFSYGNASFIPQIIKDLNNFDLIHLHWPFLGGAEAVLIQRVFKKQKSKLVIQYHMDLIASGFRGFIFKLDSFLFHSLLFKKADKILVSSLDYLRHSDLNKYWQKDKNKFLISPFGVNWQRFYPQVKKQQLLDKYHFNQGNKIILSVGGLDKAHYFKGVSILIRVMDKLKEELLNLKLLLVGEGDLKKDYQKLVSDLGIENKVVFTGRIEDFELPDYYNLSDVFVFPSFTKSEAFGLVSLEAMACAKPIIVSNLPGPRSLVEENGFIVEVNDIDDLSEKIKNIFKDKERLEKFGQKSFKLVKEKYSWPQIVKEIEKIYERIIG